MYLKDSNRKNWFKFVKKILKVFIRKPKYVYLGNKVVNDSIILSNHVGSKSPLAIELYSDFPIRCWGTYENNLSLKETYAYLTKTYYHKKKHWNLFLARLFCLIAAPLTYMFYKGINIISTYPDARLRKTFKETLETLNLGCNIVIYPEMSDEGYFDTLKGFYNGFDLLFDYLLKHNKDVDVYVAYYQRKTKTYIFDKPFKISEIKQLNLTRNDLAKKLCDRCNELGRMDIAKK